MRILILCHAFNSLTQRVHAELARRGHTLTVEFDIHDDVTTEAVASFAPDLILAPFLKRAIPEAVWSRLPCIVLHPGPVGDRGPAALDWAVLEGHESWGVTALQAVAQMDAGPVWASREFPLRPARKASLYRREVTEAGVAALLEAVERYGRGEAPSPVAPGDPRVRVRPPMRQADRAVNWSRDDSATVLRKIRSADGFPGVLDEIGGLACHLYDAYPERSLSGAPGDLLATRHGAVCRATVDGAVWITHLRRAEPGAFKLPATRVLGELAAGLPDLPLPDLPAPDEGTWQDIRYREADGVGYLEFDFYNGALGVDQARRLLAAIDAAKARPTQVLALLGGADFWCNGIHLNLIEAADSPADESWASINAIDDVARAILECDDRLTVAALGGNAGAGGVFLALAADRVWAREGVVLNPHYKNMGNLYGSEYWTYVLPRRVGEDAARALMQERLPLLSGEARARGVIDDCFGAGTEDFQAQLAERLSALAASPDWAAQVAAKRERLAADEAAKPLSAYREEELARMRLNFYGFDPSYHVARYNFVAKVPHSWTPRHLAAHRSLARKDAA